MSLSLCKKSVILTLDNPISTGIAASTPYVMENWVSPVDLFGVVR